MLRKLVKIGACEVTYVKTFQGAHKFSAIVNGYLVTKQYMGYTKKEAKQLFKLELVK